MIVIQLLNIAGLGPVFGPIIGALYGPSALLWVVFGCVLGGAVHDYMSGMISLRYGGAGYHEVLGRNLGHGVRTFMEFFTVIFLILVGAVFVAGPANLLLSISPEIPYWVWAVLIFAYYICATIFPIDKVIGKIYPFFAVLLIFMAIGLTIALFAGDTKFSRMSALIHSSQASIRRETQSGLRSSSSSRAAQSAASTPPSRP